MVMMAYRPISMLPDTNMDSTTTAPSSTTLILPTLMVGNLLMSRRLSRSVPPVEPLPMVSRAMPTP